jgi:hypothetical protein
LFASALGFGAALTSPASALTILDDFDAPAGGQAVTLTNPAVNVPQTNSVSGLAGVVGGSRDLTLEAQAVFAGGSQAQAEINLATSPGNFQLANSIRIDSVVTITYDANGAGLDTDLTAEPILRLVGVENDLATTYTITLTTNGGGTSTLSIAQAAGFTGDIDFDLASFTGTADFADIDSIALEVDGVRAADVIIDQLVTIPEPGTAATLFLGLSGLAWLGRRRPQA